MTPISKYATLGVRFWLAKKNDNWLCPISDKNENLQNEKFSKTLTRFLVVDIVFEYFSFDFVDKRISLFILIIDRQNFSFQAIVEIATNQARNNSWFYIK